jgi:N6-adenosine-specific RNA methylase IME4
MTSLFETLGALPYQQSERGMAVPPSWPWGDLKMGHYGLIYADPPWRFENYSEAGEAKNPLAHYECLTLDVMKEMPVAALAAPDCALVMWGMWSMLPEAMDLLSAWGFTYKSGGAWAKQSATGNGLAFGTGYYWRGASEFWLLGTIGAPPVLSHSIRNLILAPVREHSRKPDQMVSDLERMFGGARCELFARQSRPGWDVWGNQTDKFDTKEMNDGV